MIFATLQYLNVTTKRSQSYFQHLLSEIEKGEEEFANACPDSLKTNEEEEETDVSDDKGNKSLLTGEHTTKK